MIVCVCVFKSGVPKRKAILLQLLTAVGALTGCIVSLLLDGVTDTASQLTLPFTAGSGLTFYSSLCYTVSDMEMADPDLKMFKTKDLKKVPNSYLK